MFNKFKKGNSVCLISEPNRELYVDKVYTEKDYPFSDIEKVVIGSKVYNSSDLTFYSPVIASVVRNSNSKIDSLNGTFGTLKQSLEDKITNLKKEIVVLKEENNKCHSSSLVTYQAFKVLFDKVTRLELTNESKKVAGKKINKKK